MKDKIVNFWKDADFKTRLFVYTGAAFLLVVMVAFGVAGGDFSGLNN